MPVLCDYKLSSSSIWKDVPLHEMLKGSAQQEFCACDSQNIEPVILMSIGLFFVAFCI